MVKRWIIEMWESVFILPSSLVKRKLYYEKKKTRKPFKENTKTIIITVD